MSYLYDAPDRNRKPGSFLNRVRVRRAFGLVYPQGDVLDIGTAWGTIARAAAKVKGVGTVVGLDPDPECADYWREHPVPAVLVTGYSTTRVFDVAYAIDVLEHMTDDEVRAMFDWLNARRLVIYCPNRTSIFERKKWHPSHIGMRTLAEFLGLVPDRWQVIRTRYYGWRYFPWFNKRRWGVYLALAGKGE